MMDAMNDHESMKKVTDLLKGLYKQYHKSPKALRELKALSEILEVKVWKPTNLGGTRWLPHMERALSILMKDYPVIVSQMENTTESRSASDDMIGRAKLILKQLTHYRQLMFVVLVRDILKVLSCVSLKLQEEGVTLPKDLQAFETALLILTSMLTAPGECLEQFKEETDVESEVPAAGGSDVEALRTRFRTVDTDSFAGWCEAGEPLGVAHRRRSCSLWNGPPQSSLRRSWATWAVTSMQPGTKNA